MKNKIDSATNQLEVFLKDFEKNMEETTEKMAKSIVTECNKGSFKFKVLHSRILNGFKISIGPCWGQREVKSKSKKIKTQS